MLVTTLLALTGGLLLAGSFEPVGLLVLAPLGVAAGTVAVHRLRDRSPWRALGPGLVLGASFVLPLLSWLSAIGTDAWIAVSLLEASFYAVWAVAAAVLMRLPAWPVWVSLAWLAAETARGSWPFGGFPWGRLAFATADSPYVAGLPWWGANGVSLLVAATGVTLAWLVVEGHRRRTAAVVTVGGLAAVVLAPVLAAFTPTDAGTMRVAAVQGDVPGPGNDVLFDTRQLTDNHVEATEDLAAEVAAGDTEQPDLVVWPENSTAQDPFGDSPLRAGIDGAVEAVGAPVLVGAIVDAPTDGQVLNQGILWSPDSGPGQRYSKWHPVPFGEFVPFRDSALLGGVAEQVERLDLVPRDMLAGTRTEPLDVGGAQVADAICFDVAYDDGILAQVRSGAEVLVVQTSNALFIDTAQIDQQFEITRVRARETGRTTVVAAINGVSGVIGPDGEVLETAAPRTAAVLEADVALAGSRPPSAWVGPWLGRGAMALTVLAVVAGLLVGPAYRRRRGSEGAPAGEEQAG